MAKTIDSIAKSINNKLNSLKNKIDEIMLKQLVKVAEDTIKKVRSYIINEWYNKYTPEDYKRTLGLSDSLRYTIKNKKIHIYFDRRYFPTRKVNNGIGWQPHRDFDGNLFIDGLIDFINDGGNGGIHTNPRRNDGGIDFLSEAENIINDYADRLAKKQIKIVVDKYLKKGG